LLALVCASRAEGPLRAAFVAGKALGGAVRRNRQRRRLREACRALWPRIADRPADIVFVAQPRAATAGFAAMVREMEMLLQRAGLLPPNEGNGPKASR